ncbi:MAG: hypothetical protein ABGZ49_04280 [Akkermansiaceae bacterium]|nr:hypothetical protein [Roseibacillus sp.]
MMIKLIPTLALSATVLLASCGEKEVEGTIPQVPPAPPTPEVVTALEAQPFGKKLLGKTKVLVGENYVSADLQSAPEYYLLFFSASW